MTFCTACGEQFDANDRFCSKCGAAKDGPDEAPRAVETETRPQGLSQLKKRKIFLRSLLALPIWAVIIWAVFNFNGCSSTEGSVSAQGEPLGAMNFVPQQCRSGEHESFYGVFLLGEDETSGAIKAVVDARDGDFLDVELPGSCKGPDNDDCTTVRVGPSQCTTFDLQVTKTDTWVNEIRLLDGSLKLDCTFEQGGTLVADVRFESCD